MNSFNNKRLREGAITALASLLLVGVCAAEVPIVDLWRFTTEAPQTGWQSPDFDDSHWPEAYGGFGTPKRDRLRVETAWETENIWLRKVVVLESVPDNPALYISYNDAATVYLNGVEIADLSDSTLRYRLLPLTSRHAETLREGKNVLAVHAWNEQGLQFVDAHLASAGEEPELPLTHSKSVPYDTALITRCGQGVTPGNAWTEYPRPQMVRQHWENLNGIWDYAVTPAAQQETPEDWTGKILVPFALESKLGEVQRLLQPDEALWYKRQFEVGETIGIRTLLNFEAVDYQCRVWVNDILIGSHQGGNTPFSLDATDAVRSGANTLLVRVEDDTEAWQLRGKQVLEPKGIWYTRVSGIWQTVWLEQVPLAYIEDLTIHSDVAAGTLTLTVEVAGEAAHANVRATVKDHGAVVATHEGMPDGLTLTVANPKLWTPSAPHLYALEVELLDAKGETLDRVSSYAGIRTVGKTRDADGHLRFTLNGQTIFHWGPLDQGWWPDGLLTPPSDEAMRYDIELICSEM